VGGCFKCHAAVAQGQTRLNDKQMVAAIRGWDEFAVSMRPITVPMMAVMVEGFGYTVIGEVIIPLVTAGEPIAEKVINSPEVQVVFGQGVGHGARHLAGTGLDPARVEALITQVIQQDAAAASAVGQHWGQISVEGTTLIYRAYPLAQDLINVGTYYPAH
jgi:hypothetical protein